MMTKQRFALAVGLTTLFSTPALAVQNGAPVNWADHSNVVIGNNGSKCTGTVLGGQWVITAAHCNASGALGTVQLADNATLSISQQIPHPAYGVAGNNAADTDIALWKLQSAPQTKHITALSPRDIVDLEPVQLYGFGGSGTALNVANMQAWSRAQSQNKGAGLIYILTKDTGQGISVPGDSGGPFFTSSNEVIGINVGSSTFTPLVAAKNFITDTVNAWHYPTLATTANGSVTITVQSLHKNIVADSAYTDGDATITGGTCMGASTIQPFDTCTYLVASNGGEGKIYLSSSEAVTINKKVAPAPTTPPTPTSNSGGGSGGSLGFLSLLGLFGTLLTRRSAK